MNPPSIIIFQKNKPPEASAAGARVEYAAINTERKREAAEQTIDEAVNVGIDVLLELDGLPQYMKENRAELKRLLVQAIKSRDLRQIQLCITGSRAVLENARRHHKRCIIL